MFRHVTLLTVTLSHNQKHQADYSLHLVILIFHQLHCCHLTCNWSHSLSALTLQKLSAVCIYIWAVIDVIYFENLKCLNIVVPYPPCMTLRTFNVYPLGVLLCFIKIYRLAFKFYHFHGNAALNTYKPVWIHTRQKMTSSSHDHVQWINSFLNFW